MDDEDEIKANFELRGVGDYGVTAHVSQSEAERAILAAASFSKD